MEYKFKFITKYAKPYKALFTTIFIVIMVSAFSGSLYPYIMGKLIDEVLGKGDLQQFLIFFVSYGVVFLADQSIHFVINFLWSKLMTKFIYDIRKASFDKVLSYRAIRLGEVKPGDVLQRINKDAEQIIKLIHNNIFFGLSRVLNLIFSLWLIFRINSSIAVIVFLLVPIIVYSSKWFNKRVKIQYKKISEESGKLSSWLFEMIKGMHEIKLLSATGYFLRSYVEKSIKINRLKIKVDKIELISERCNAGILLIGQMILYTISAILIYQGQLSIGGFTACISYYNTCLAIFDNLNNKANSIVANMVSLERVIRLLDEPSEEYHADKEGFSISHGTIKFEHVSFGYNEQASVLRDISFTVDSGQQIALVGHSGVGKSTIVNLIYKLYEIQSGKILIDGFDIRDFNLYTLREQIGIVHQETIVFEGTVRFNLIYSDDKTRDQELWDALKRSCLAEYIYTLPKGLDTVIGTSGQQLSGGQKQRLAIARVFIKNPQILIFDEATSSVDIEAEQIIKESWEALRFGRTIIIVAHRLSTILGSDKILVLNDGIIAGYDKHEFLIKHCDIYKQLFHQQFSIQMEVADV